jgi:phage I-like protein
VDKHFGWWIDTSKLTLSDDMAWVHALPRGKYQHPVYGELDFSDPKLNAYAASVTNRVRGIDPDIDYDHKTDPAKGNQAAGWVKAAQVRENGLWLGVEFTDDAKKEIKEKKYRYFSADFGDEWQDPEGKVHQDVLFGGGLTNRPYMKNLLPVNLSELTGNNQPSRVEDEVDGKKLREALGLAADTTDDAVFAKLGEIAKAVTELSDAKTKLTEAEATIAKLSEKEPEVDAEMKKLIEGSPAMKKLYEDNLAKDKKLKELAESMRLGEVNAQLAELNQGEKVALAPVARDGLRDVMVAMPPDQAKKLHEVMQLIMDGKGTVDLSEAPVRGRRSDSDVDPTKRFNDAIKTLMEGPEKLDYGRAAEKVARDNPTLFEEYRAASYIVPKA